MQICTFTQFSDRLKKCDNRPLRCLSLEITRKCNFKCNHCFCVSADKNNLEEQTELPFSFWKEVLDQSAKEGALWLTFTGGDPLLHKDFKKIWEYSKRSGYITTLFTNGSLVTPEIADFLAEYTPNQVSITLYGGREETYAKMTGRKNMFDKVIRGINQLHSRKINLEIKSVINTLNIADFEAIRDISLKYCKTFRWDASLVGPYKNCTNEPKKNRLSAQDYVMLESRDPVRLEQMAQTAKRKIDPSQKGTRAARCNVGNGGVHIDYLGQMHPCILLEMLSYDLTQGNVHDGWRQAIPALIDNIDFSPEDPCVKCSAVELCGQCVGFALLEGAPASGPVPYRCQLARERAEHHGVLQNYPDLIKFEQQ